jgi:hypothetical protein
MGPGSEVRDRRRPESNEANGSTNGEGQRQNGRNGNGNGARQEREQEQEEREGKCAKGEMRAGRMTAGDDRSMWTSLKALMSRRRKLSQMPTAMPAGGGSVR